MANDEKTLNIVIKEQGAPKTPSVAPRPPAPSGAAPPSPPSPPINDISGAPQTTKSVAAPPIPPVTASPPPPPVPSSPVPPVAAGAAAGAGAARVGGTAAASGAGATAGASAAGAALAALTTPIGALVVAAGAVVVALGAVVTAGEAVSALFAGMAQDLRRFSPILASAQAESNYRRTVANIEQAQQLGDELADFTQLRTDIDLSIQRATTQLIELFYPIAKAILKILQAITYTAEFTTNLLSAANEKIEAAGNWFNDQWYSWFIPFFKFTWWLRKKITAWLGENDAANARNITAETIRKIRIQTDTAFEGIKADEGPKRGRP